VSDPAEVPDLHKIKARIEIVSDFENLKTVVATVKDLGGKYDSTLEAG
jgi:hypothetical protein